MARNPVIDGHKLCTMCGQMKPVADYYFYKAKGHLFGPCKSCNRLRSDAWRKANPAKFNAVQRKSYHKNPGAQRRSWLKKLYGITPEQYDEMWTSQGGACAICGDTKPKKLHVDHCHKTNQIRGLLCRNCNLGIGNMQENINTMHKAIAYLKRGPLTGLTVTPLAERSTRRYKKHPPPASAIN